MHRILCPKCNAIVAINIQENRTRVPCVKCSYRFPLSEAKLYVPPKPLKRKLSTLGRYSAWLPAMALLMMGVLLAFSSVFSRRALNIALVVSVMCTIIGLIWGTVLAAADGAYVGLNYLKLSSGAAKWILFVAVMLGYPVYLLVKEIQYAWRSPKRYGPALALQLLGVLLLIVAPAMSTWSTRDTTIAAIDVQSK
ncbi:MAG TPA: hypothetical protein VFE62_16995 [Gemmataceae bacterium]|nr:hypothetical protein [Gemmataceae bacterium]